MSRGDQGGVLDAVTTEGGLLPAELLQRVAAGDKELPGLSPADYHLGKGETLAESITRSWNRLLGAWTSFREELARRPEDDPVTSLTRDKWLLPLFQELGYGRLPKSAAIELDGRSFPISHAWHRSPIHLLGARTALDRRTPGQAGAATASPHGLVQDFLNRSDDHLWAFLSNGLQLRVLRDHRSLTRLAYVEVDLEAMFEGELFHVFRLLWLLCHQSRVEAERPEECWLEKWFEHAREDGIRALDHLRDGVERAIEALGRGFLRHSDNAALHEALGSDPPSLSKQDYYRELLRLVYRCIFLFAAEDREVLLDPAATPAARARYDRFYSTRRIRELARRHRGGSHGDLWQHLRLVMSQLDDGCPALALPALGSFLWSRQCVPHLEPSALANEDLLAAIRALSTFRDGRQLYPVNFRNVGAEELGSVYESLLELHPEVHRGAAGFTLRTSAGHERKTTGSYYTPTSLVDCLLDSALDPVLDEAANKPTREEAERAILDLKVCDPACGSGHFLVAAGRRIARRLALVRAGGEEPSPQQLRHALRDVVGRCLYGVDVNQMAAELCKVSLWLEAVEPGRPLSFLESHIQVGNSLLGATPALMEKGIPDEAFEPIEGDDKVVARALKKQNKRARDELFRGQTDLYGMLVPRAVEPAAKLSATARELEAAPDEDISAVRKKDAAWQLLVGSDEYIRARFVADAWCAAFVWPKQKGVLQDGAVTHGLWLRLRGDPGAAPEPTRREVKGLARQFGFLHWHLAFPQVFGQVAEASVGAASGGGFDVVLGNPPWERIKVQEKEFFAERSPKIAEAAHAAARKRLIAELPKNDPDLWHAWREALRRSEGESHLLRATGRYPLCGRGDINTYAIFAELNRSAISATGRVGCILPAGIAMDDTTKLFFQEIARAKSLVSLFHFENEEHVFPAVDNGFRFCLLTISGRGRPVGTPTFVALARQATELKDSSRVYSLSLEDFQLLNPNTFTFPAFRHRRDAEINRSLYQRIPILLRDAAAGREEANPWGVSFLSMLHMASDSDLFRRRDVLEGEGWKLDGNAFSRDSGQMLPLYEAKMIHHCDHRFGTYDGQTQAQANKGFLPQLGPDQHSDPALVALPRYWVERAEVDARLADRWDRGWLLGWRDICRSRDQRTVIAAVVPRVAVGHSLPLFMVAEALRLLAHCLVANLASFVLDYASRQKVGGTHLTFGVMEQLPVLPPAAYGQPPRWCTASSLGDWLRPRVVELTYTAWDLAPFARDCGYDGPPFRWDTERRFWLRAELDAAFFHLYGIARDDVDYIMDSFWIVRAQDEKAHGLYRTKEAILDLYDRLATATKTGQAYQTVLDPLPADSRVAHAPPSEPAVRRLAATSAASAPALSSHKADVWATPPGVSEANVALFGLVEALRAFGGPADEDRVRIAALLVRKPALAIPFMDAKTRREWERVVGDEARPLPANVIPIARFQRNATDRPWADAVRQLKASGGLVEDRSARAWAASDRLPPSGQAWMEGRAAVAVRLVVDIDAAKAEQNLVAFVKDVERGTAGKSVS